MIVKEILTNAIYKSLQDRALNPVVDPGFLLFALFEFNQLLDEWRDHIPYNSFVTFNNVNDLQNSKFVQVETVNYILNNVSFPIMPVGLDAYKRIQNIVGLLGFPQIYFFDELQQTINIYPLPSNPSYQFTIWGKIQQLYLGLSDTVPANMPPFMVKALTNELAFIIASEYGTPWDSKKESIRQSALASLIQKKSIDLSPEVNIVFGQPNQRIDAPFPYFYFISGGGQ
jgi:hypothetical protein